MNWIQDLLKPERRQWEKFYRNRWQHDRVVRSTHGANCTGGCSWMVYVNDGIEAYNDNGVVVARAVVSAQTPREIGFYCHAPERTISIPQSPLRGNRRAGWHNSLTRIRLKSLLMVGLMPSLASGLMAGALRLLTGTPMCWLEN